MMAYRTYRRAFFSLASAAAMLCAACSRVPCYPVRGQVIMDGKPAKGAQVLFFPAQATASDFDALKPAGSVAADGSFSLHTYFPKDRTLRDGAPAGEYIVLITWIPDDVPIGSLRNLPLDAIDQLQGRFSDSKKSSFRAEVKERPNELPPLEIPKSAFRPFKRLKALPDLRDRQDDAPPLEKPPGGERPFK